MRSIHISDAKAAILHHFFAPADSAADLFRRFAAVQIDPITIVAPNHVLVVDSRSKGSHENLLRRGYADEQIIEIYAKERCLVPREDAPLFAPLLSARREEKRAFFAAYRREIAEAMAVARKAGCVSVTDLSFQKQDTVDRWGPRGDASAVLGFLWEIGELVVASRTGRNVTYRPAPPGLWAPNIRTGATDAEIRLRRWQRYIDGVAITDARDSFAGFERCVAAERLAFLNTVVAGGYALRVTGLNDAQRFCVVSQRVLDVLDNKRLDGSCLPCFVPPLDNFLWNRQLIKAVWGFDYRWEIYSPPAKRTHGAYAMPLITSTGIFGPLDFRFDRPSSCLVGQFSRSPLATASPRVRAAAKVAAEKLAAVLGAEKLSLL